MAEGQFVQNPDGSWSQLTQSTGSKVTYTRQKTFDTLQIRDTAAKTGSILPMNGDDKKVVAIYNQLDQAVNFTLNGRATVATPFLSKAIVPSISVAAATIKIFDGGDYVSLDKPYEHVYGSATATVAPTTGQLDAWVVNHS